MTPEEAVNAVRTTEIKSPTYAQVEAFLRAAGYKPTRRLSDGYVVWATEQNARSCNVITLVEKPELGNLFNFTLLAVAIERHYYPGHDERRCAQIIAIIAEIEVDTSHDNL